MLPSGESAVLVEPADARTVVSLYTLLLAGRPSWVVELVPAAETILVVYDRQRVTRSGVEKWMRGAAHRVTSASASASSTDAARTAPAVELAVRYDGPDLPEVADSLGLSVEALIQAHTATSWHSAFIGFAPGFAYLTPETPRFDVPRRAAPRTAVPAGSVALAAGYCGVYPRESPGGWQLIGTTAAELWDPTRAHPALLAPGTPVRFVRVG